MLLGDPPPELVGLNTRFQRSVRDGRWMIEKIDGLKKNLALASPRQLHTKSPRALTFTCLEAWPIAQVSVRVFGNAAIQMAVVGGAWSSLGMRLWLLKQTW